ncbi:50S ribosomal protein P1 [Candidatus Woesearchaeota archaeon]|nr:50S ribosomal protein P1 [Candidatus Woesearchaeota archaeon]
MEYVYSALLLYRAGKAIDEHGVKKVLEAAGIKVDEGRVKALVAALDGVNIDEAIKEAAVVSVAAPAAASGHAAHAPEAKKEEKKPSEDAAAGLGSLFG